MQSVFPISCVVDVTQGSVAALVWSCSTIGPGIGLGSLIRVMVKYIMQGVKH